MRSMLSALKAVFWSFFGVRKKKDYAEDIQKLTLKQVVVAGVLGALVFVLCLLGVVYLVTR